MVKEIDVDKLTDAELRTELLKFGFPVMPITGTTRKVMAKKLKLLLENKNKVSTESGRRSLGRYSSEEESDTEVKSAKKDKRRVTMAAPTITKAAKKIVIEPELPKKRESRNATVTTTTTTTRSSRILKQAKDEFDTGSDSESDILVSSNNLEEENGEEYSRRSPIKPATLSSSFGSRYSPPKAAEPAFTPDRHTTFASTSSATRHTSFGSPSLASEYAADRLNQIRNRLSLGSPSYDRPASYASPVVSQEQEEPVKTPFLSNFTRRLSALSSGKKPTANSRNDMVKEHDTNGTARSYLSSFRATKGREPLYNDYKSGKLNGGKNNYISMAVLAGAGLFFVFLAIVYLGLRSDTSLISGGYIKPLCTFGDPHNKKGVNCLNEDDATQAVNLLNVIRPELLKRSVAHKCFDSKIKAHMTEAEVVTFCQSNFGIKNADVIRGDLTNLEIMLFANPEWGVGVVQTENNDGTVYEEDAARNMEQVIFNKGVKTTSLVIFNPDLPWKCTFYQSLASVAKTILFIGAIFLTLYLASLGFKYYRQMQQKNKEEVTLLVEKILEIMQNAVEENGENFLVINHVRDMILSVTERRDKKQSWDKAVQYVNENESRIRTEVQTVQGESFEVWRWIGSNLNRSGSPSNKSWQGQAFETQVGSVNSLPCSPTPCLKIRGMIEEGDTSINARAAKDAVLSKCAHSCRLLHCQAEPSSGCVYLKCVDPQDAAVAYRNLHGWWYDGQLVTVKYLRLERYMQRFPESPIDGPPFLKSASPSID